MTQYRMPKTRHLLLVALSLVMLVMVWACANVVAPLGGPRDETPPKVVRSTPPNFSTNFKYNQIRIFFDEFVQLHNIRQQLLVSPPMEKTPEVRIRGRSIIIEIEEELRTNSTYNLFFGDAIRDITEGNAIPNFQFVFSTGDYVDSLSVSGEVINAFNHDPEEGVYVLLYDNIYDSVPYLERPVYLAKTDKEGRFRITNMADGEYLMFGLRDNNANFKYDLPDEKIAFIDSLVSPEYIKPPSQHPGKDTIPEENDNDTEPGRDTIPDANTLRPGEQINEMNAHRETPAASDDHHIEGDSLIKDLGKFYTLYLFQERDTVQRVTSSALTKKGLITIAFRIPFDSAYVREIRQPFEEPWHIPEFTKNRDTLKIWFADTGRDSLFLEISDRGRVLDTIARATTPRLRRGETEDIDSLQTLNITMGYRRATAVPFFKPVTIISEHPLEKITQDKFELLAHDSIPVESSFSVTDNTKRTVIMDPLPEEGTSYTLNIMPGAFTDIFGLTNDTIQSRFRTTTRENHGNLVINVDIAKEGEQHILQLLDRNRAVLDEKIFQNDGTYTFKHLGTGNYQVRLIYDLNGNGKWDTGNYLEMIQPEPVFMFPETIQIRENWDIEITLQGE